VLKFTKEQTLIVDHGRVMCPLRGDIDVEFCLGCKSLREVELEDRRSFITCDGWGLCAAEAVPAIVSI
jgi:hypothetical protein